MQLRVTSIDDLLDDPINWHLNHLISVLDLDLWGSAFHEMLFEVLAFAAPALDLLILLPEDEG